MKYRRFGKTELQIPVISCGGCLLYKDDASFRSSGNRIVKVGGNSWALFGRETAILDSRFVESHKKRVAELSDFDNWFKAVAREDLKSDGVILFVDQYGNELSRQWLDLEHDSWILAADQFEGQILVGGEAGFQGFIAGANAKPGINQ